MRLAVALTLVVLLAAPAGAAVVVELFTSQGCASCPPADELLHELRRDPNVIVVAYHVDYWDRLGWRDPFSARDWTIRQMEYVRAMHLPSAYTPQIVVGGKRQMVGSNGTAVRKAIADAMRESGGTAVALSLADGVAVVETNAPRAGLDLIVIAVEDEAVTRIERGENAGLTLRNDAIARKLVRVRDVPAGEHVHRLSVRGQRIVAMLQDPESLVIVAAASR